MFQKRGIVKAIIFSLLAAMLLPMGAYAQTGGGFPPDTAAQKAGWAIVQGGNREINAGKVIPGGPRRLSDAAEAARETVHEALRQHKDRIDVSAYKLTDMEASQLVEDILYWDGSLFYVDFCDTDFNASAYDLPVRYLDVYYIEHEAEVTSAIKKAVRDSITPDMSDLQKALALHNWLALHSYYDKEAAKNPSSGLDPYSAYGALVLGKSVCEGYAQAYRMLMNYVGIETIVVSGKAGGPHAWNQIKIDGQWYHVDVTWDSKGSCSVGGLSYNYFLISDDEISKDHTMIPINEENYFTRVEHECISTLYDDGGWWDPGRDNRVPLFRGIAAPINRACDYRIEHTSYNFSRDARMDLIYRDDATGVERVVRTFDHTIWKNQQGGWEGCCGNLIRVGGIFFLNDTKTIYRIAEDGSISEIYTYNGGDDRKIFGIGERNGNLQFLLGYGPSLKESTIETISLSSYVTYDDDVSAFVKRLYTVCLGRKYDEAGLNDWVSKLDSHTQTAAEVAQGFFFSEEFQNKGYSDQEYVEILYHTMFDRDGDEGGTDNWLGLLENGMSRLYIYRGFAQSNEFSNLCDKYDVIQGSVELSAYRDRNEGATGFIARLYTKMLGRPFDEEGLENWCRAYLTGERTIEDIASDGFLHSQELLNKNLSDEEFVTRMYRTFLNREPDAPGLTDWVTRLRTGQESRDTLVYGFTKSSEFSNLKASYGLQ